MKKSLWRGKEVTHIAMNVRAIIQTFPVCDTHTHSHTVTLSLRSAPWERESRTKRLLCCALQSLIGFSSLSEEEKGIERIKENKRTTLQRKKKPERKRLRQIAGSLYKCIQCMRVCPLLNSHYRRLDPLRTKYYYTLKVDAHTKYKETKMINNENDKLLY